MHSRKTTRSSEFAEDLPFFETKPCPECGAGFNIYGNCREVFDTCLSLEFSKPEYGVVHHLTVCTYNLQHPSKLSYQGWEASRQLLHDFIIDGKSPEQIRRSNNKQVDNQYRKWKITGNKGTENKLSIEWSKTILEVRLDEPDNYCTDIKAWALSTLNDCRASL